MALASTFQKTRKDIQKTLTDSGALDAVVGAGDLAVKKLREARADLSARAESIQADVKHAPDLVKAAPELVKSLPAHAQAALGEAVAGALATYEDLSVRGKDLVTRVRGQQATQDLKAQAAATVSHAKATTTTAKKSAAATKTASKSASTTAKKSAASTKTAAKSATTTAKKSAARTRTSAKSTNTGVKKTASAAAKAAGDAASKVGN